MASTGGPVATASIANRPAAASSSLYQAAISVKERCTRVPGFAELFLSPNTPFTTTDEAEDLPTDPVSVVCHFLRLGASLCFLFNALRLPEQLEINTEATRRNLKACQRSAAHFIMACQRNLEIPVDELFSVSQDTSGTVAVISTVNRLLDMLESRGLLMEPLEVPIDSRAVEALDDESRQGVCQQPEFSDVDRILESERKYVQDLDFLQEYRARLLRENILPVDIVQSIFANLNQLVDFQRRFLIGVEAHAEQSGDAQRFGHLFMSMEDSFAVYEPYCANFTRANDLVQQENAELMVRRAKYPRLILQRLSHVLDPNYELPTFLIKPVQRICKLPLLMQQLVKMSDPSSAHYQELIDGHESIKRVTDKVNETKRQADNELAVRELGRRVDDWKGHDIVSFGQLLLEDTFTVLKGESEREYKVYLFQRIVLCCKEVGAPQGGKKGSKSYSLQKRPHSKRETTLQLKGRIFIANITQAVPMQRGTAWFLEIIWRGDNQDESFSLKCRTEEILRLWQRSVTQAVEDNLATRRSRQQALSGSSSSSFRRLASPLSQFPGTPQSEMTGPLSSQSEFSPFHFGSASQSSASLTTAYHDYEGEDAQSSTDTERTPMPSSGRRTPATQSLPSGARHANGLPPRPRTHTEDAHSVIHEWRAATPPYGAPGLPGRGSSGPSASDPALRSSTASRVLRTKPSTEWGSASPSYGFERPPPISRNGSQASLPTAPGMHRSRSASSPHVYQGANGSSSSQSLPLGRTASQQDEGVPLVPPLNVYARNAPSPHPFAQRAHSRNDKRISASSMGTDRSSDSTGAGAYTSSPASTVPPSSTASTARRTTSGAQAHAIRLKVHYGDDTFVIAILSTATHAELLDKVLRKLRNCSAPIDEGQLRLRYVDEDQDRVVLRDDDDVALAFGLALQLNAPALTLYAS